MPFRSGSVSYARFHVVGGIEPDDAAVIEALSGRVVEPPPVGLPPALQAGWCAGQHVFDIAFDHQTLVFGPHVLFGMRLDRRQVPSEVRRAYRAMAESALRQEGQQRLTASQRQAAREQADEQCRQELADGQHCRSRLVPVLWDRPRQVLLTPTFNEAAATALSDLFKATFDCGLTTMSAGPLARQLQRGRRRDLDDARPSSLTPPPPAATAGGDEDLRTPMVPWARGGPEPQDFLGNEFLIWLWWCSDVNAGMIETASGPVAVVFDRVLDMDCAWDATGRQMLRANGPTRLPEAIKALQLGKWPRKAGLLIAAGGEQWSLALQGDRFFVTATKLPKPEDPADITPRGIVEQRVESTIALDHVLVDLYQTFLDQRLDATWSTHRDQLRSWIRREPRRAPVDKVEV